jgi:hypothetical protein
MHLPIATDRLGVVAAGLVEPVIPWVDGPEGKRRPGTEQERDAETGHPLWSVHVMIVGGNERPTVAAVRVPSPTCPETTALSPVVFERLNATARVNRTTGQLAVYWDAAGVVPPHHRAKQDA